MRRRQFVTLIGSAAIVWPLTTVRAQQQPQRRRVGMLFNLAADDPEAQARYTAFVQGMQELGWTDRRNLRIDTRWATDRTLLQKYAADLVALAPDVIVASSNQVIAAVQRANRDVQIVFTATTDPVGDGIVESLAQPGGNATGFTSGEFVMSTKWLDLLKEIAPGVTRVAFLAGPNTTSSAPQFAAVQTIASSLRVALRRIDLAGDAAQIDRPIAAFAAAGNGGLIVSRTGDTIAQRKLIIALAAQHRLPTVYPLRLFITDGGLASYGTDIVDQFRRAAGYVDRILKGERPADLPVQTPTKFELVINLKTAKALGLTVTPSLLATADEVIE